MNFQSLRILLGKFRDERGNVAPYVATVENERFDNRQPGILRFDFVLVAKTQHSL